MREVPIRFAEKSLFDGVEYVDGHAYNRQFQAGDARWLSNVDGEPNAALQFICPCGCHSLHCVSTHKGEKVERAWLWNGNVEKPTLTPSIQCTTPCRWHGFLTDGVFKQC